MNRTFYLLSNGAISNIPPDRYSELSISALVVFDGMEDIEYTRIHNPSLESALDHMRWKGKKGKFEDVFNLLKNASFSGVRRNGDPSLFLAHNEQ